MERPLNAGRPKIVHVINGHGVGGAETMFANLRSRSGRSGRHDEVVGMAPAGP